MPRSFQQNFAGVPMLSSERMRRRCLKNGMKFLRLWDRQLWNYTNSIHILSVVMHWWGTWDLEVLHRQQSKQRHCTNVRHVSRRFGIYLDLLQLFQDMTSSMNVSGWISAFYPAWKMFFMLFWWWWIQRRILQLQRISLQEINLGRPWSLLLTKQRRQCWTGLRCLEDQTKVQLDQDSAFRGTLRTRVGQLPDRGCVGGKRCTLVSWFGWKKSPDVEGYAGQGG